MGPRKSSKPSTSNPAFRIYGLTGGIASGKTTVAGFFRELGVTTVNADEIARELRRPGGGAEKAILEKFGTLDSAALRSRIAVDPDAKKELEAILHPLIREDSLRRFAALALAGSAYAVYEAALLVESGRAGDFAGIILVENTPERQLEWLVKRDGMLPDDARRFLQIQAPLETKRTSSTHFIANDGNPEGLREKVKLLHGALLQGAKTFRI